MKIAYLFVDLSFDAINFSRTWFARTDRQALGEQQQKMNAHHFHFCPEMSWVKRVFAVARFIMEWMEDVLW